MSYEKDKAFGQKAKHLLENEVLKKAFEDIRQHYVDALVACPIRDIEGMQKIKMMIANVDKLHEVLLNYVKSGQVAEKELTWKQKILKQS